MNDSCGLMGFFAGGRMLFTQVHRGMQRWCDLDDFGGLTRGLRSVCKLKHVACYEGSFAQGMQAISRSDSFARGVLGLSFVLILLVVPGVLQAMKIVNNDVEVLATMSERQIFTGERITVSIEIRGSNFRNVGRPVLPNSFPGLRVLSLQPSTSTQFSLINGVATRTYSYTYTFSAETPGSHQFPAVSIDVDGTRFTTAPVAFTIIDRNQQQAARQGSGGGGAGGGGTGGGAATQRADIYVALELSDRSPVAGQQILADLVLYFRTNIDVVSYQTNTNWVTDGFWKESLSDGTSPRAESVIVDGERYRRAVLLRHALFPSRSGTLTIGAAGVSATIRNTGRQGADPFSSFFGGFGTNQRTVDLATEPVRLEVRALPDAGNRITLGAVGDFRINRRVTPETVTAGEALEIITEISGLGNLGLISRPVYPFPESFEVFQPQENLNINRSLEGISGNRVFRDIVIVRRPGTYEIPAAELSWYDPQRRRFVNASLPARSVTVLPDVSSAAVVQQRTLALNPVVGVVNWRKTSFDPVWSSWWFYGGLVLPVMLFMLAWFKKREDDRLRYDTGYARKIRALDTALGILNDAAKQAGGSQPDVKFVMTRVQEAVYALVTDKLNLPRGGHSDEDILRYLKEKNLPDDTISETRRLLTKCSTIRFAPVIARENLEYELGRAREVIKKIGDGLK
jgi:hypothetical protein